MTLGATMKIKTADLTGPALDFAVSKADNPPGQDGWGWWDRDEQGFLFDPLNECRYSPSTDWAQGGPIIERDGMHVDCLRQGKKPIWEAWPYASGTKHIQQGPTPLIAAMRCFVASKLGDEVDVPEELV